MRGGGHKFWRDTALLALIAAVARLLFLYLIPVGAESIDLRSWQKIATELHAGRNPYQSTPLLNWPPLWMQLIALTDKVSQVLHVPFKTLLRILLIASDVAVVVVTHRLAVFLELAKARLIVLIGLALNPIGLLLVCQHANFDTIVALAIVLSVAALVRFRATKRPVDWLFAALSLGVGILAKTIPVILVPLLAARSKDLDRSTRLLGALLLVGPVAIGLSVLFVLAPQAVYQHVINYRSLGGVFGVSGIVAATLTEQPARAVRIVMLLTLGLIFLLSTVRTTMRGLDDPRTLILLGAFLLVSIIVFGPGYGPQYIMWFLPLLTLTAGMFDPTWRRILFGWGIVAVVTYAVEYLLLPSHGALLFHLFPGRSFPFAGRLETPWQLTCFRLPLFLSYCLVWVKAGSLLVERERRMAIHPID